MSFQYFEEATHVSAYNLFRPSPPNTLIDRILSFIREKNPTELKCAIDVGCGSGQSTHALAQHFQDVIGLDPSSAIIEEARKKNTFTNVTFEVSSAENIPRADESVDLIIAVQAIHWFELSKFYTEVKRVLKKNGVLAIVGYKLPEPQYRNRDAGLKNIILKYYTEVLGDYILPQSKKVYLNNYKEKEFNNISFQVEPLLREEHFVTKVEADVSALVGYVSTWSGFQNYQNLEGLEKSKQILANFEQEVRNEMKKGEKSDSELTEDTLIINYHYFVLLGRKEI